MTHSFSPSSKKVTQLLLLAGLILFNLVAEGFSLPSTTEDVSKSTKKRSLQQPPETSGINPVITIEDPYNAGVFEVAVGSEETHYYFVGGSGFSPNTSVTIELSVTDSEPFTILAADAVDFGKTMSITKSTTSEGIFESEMIAVKYKPTTEGSHHATITHSSTGADSQLFPLDGNISSTPVQWQSFHAKTKKGTIILEWTTASEENNSHFEIETSKDPIAGFKKAGRVNSKVGNSKTATNYTFPHPIKGVSGLHYFRLKQVDNDAEFSYSKVTAIEVPEERETKPSFSPNPASNLSLLHYIAPYQGTLMVQIFNLNGLIVDKYNFNVNMGNNRINLPLKEKIPAGMYLLHTDFYGKTSQLKVTIL